MNRDGTAQVPLPGAAIAAKRAPVWSPDGTKVAYAADADRTFCCSYDIYVMSRDGTGVTRLTTQLPTTSSPSGNENPDWQPIVGPTRSHYKNASHFCKAERAFFGEAAFRERYGGGANAHGKCASGN